MKRKRTRSTPSHSRRGRYDAGEEPVFLQVTMLLVKGALGFLVLVMVGVALMNYRVLLHHDGQVEFARKSEWTLADSFRFIGEDGVASPAPPAPAPAPAAVVARVVPLPIEAVAPAVREVAPPVHAPAPVIVSVAHPPAPVARRAPVAMPSVAAILARARPAKPVVKPSEDEGEDPIRAMLSTVRPVEAPTNPEAADCRRVRAKLKTAVQKMDAAHPREKASELHLFELIQEGYLDSLQSCPSLGGYALQRRASAPEIRCTVHGAL